jgi:hypothetical protein
MMEDLIASDFSTIERRSGENFSASRKTSEHREALLALREKRPPRYHDDEYMAKLASELGLP